MKALDLLRDFARIPVATAYLFVGEAELLMEEAWALLLGRFVPARARHFNGERLLAGECTPADVIAKAHTLPMFGSKQLLMVRNIQDWTGDQRKQMLLYLERPVPTSCLVLTASTKKGLEKLAAAVEPVGLVVDFPAITEKDAPRWLQQRARHHGKGITTQAATLLVDTVGVDLHSLERELEKLAAYVGERERIDVEDVSQTATCLRSFSVFELLDRVSARRPLQAAAILRSLLLAGQHPLGILGLLARQVRMVWQVKDGLERGMSKAEIGERLGLKPYVIGKYAEQATRITHKDLLQTHRAILEADIAMKSTRLPHEAVLESLVLSLCHGKKQER